MKIAICDDNKNDIYCLYNMIENYATVHNKNIKMESFSSGVELLNTLNAHNNINYYAIVFLDIIMPVINGIEIAREIRAKNNMIEIVFLTSSTEFAIESYSINAFNYLIKPIKEENLIATLQRHELLYNSKEPYIIINNKKSVHKITLFSIRYIESINHDLNFHLADNSVITFRGKISAYENDLCSKPNFIRVHRSYIVNFDYIKSIDIKNITMIDDTTIPLVRGKYQELSDLWLKYKLQEI